MGMPAHSPYIEDGQPVISNFKYEESGSATSLTVMKGLTRHMPKYVQGKFIKARTRAKISSGERGNLKSIPLSRRPDGEFIGLVRVYYQFLLSTRCTRKTRNWETGVKSIKAPGRPCLYFHPGIDHLSQVVRAEHGDKHEPTRDEYQPEEYTDQRYISSRYSSPKKAETRSHRITVVVLFPEPLRETRRSHVCP